MLPLQQSVHCSVWLCVSMSVCNALTCPWTGRKHIRYCQYHIKMSNSIIICYRKSYLSLLVSNVFISCLIFVSHRTIIVCMSAYLRELGRLPTIEDMIKQQQWAIKNMHPLHTRAMNIMVLKWHQMGKNSISANFAQKIQHPKRYF